MFSRLRISHPGGSRRDSFACKEQAGGETVNAGIELLMCLDTDNTIYIHIYNTHIYFDFCIIHMCRYMLNTFLALHDIIMPYVGTAY